MENLVTELILAHAAIVFVFFLHGALVILNFPRILSGFESITSLPSFLILAFSISILFNTVIALAFSFLLVNFAFAGIVLITLNSVLLVMLMIRRSSADWLSKDVFIANTVLVVVAALFFVVMLLNGGLIDVLADSWWHMSLANKIKHYGTLFLNKHHLTAISVEGLGYEPVWHANFALLLALTDLPAPLIWHALAPWSVTLSLFAYYLFTYVLTGKKFVALLSIVLFALLLGGLNSYFRVSPWPGNASYILWYFALFVSLLLLKQHRPQPNEGGSMIRKLPTVQFIINALQNQPNVLVLIGLALVSIVALHLAEIVWFVFAFIFYGIVLALLDLSGNEPDIAALRRDRQVIQPIVVGLVGAGVVVAYTDQPRHDVLISVVAAMLVLTFAVAGARRIPNQPLRRLAVTVSFAILCAALWTLADFNHLKALVFPGAERLDLSYYGYYIPKWSEGLFREPVALPYWEHQLRTGLLFSGLAGVIASAYLFARSKSRASVFLFANAIIPLLILITPFLFTYLSFFLPLYGIYRVHLLIFHPVCVAYACFCLFQDAFARGDRYDRRPDLIS